MKRLAIIISLLFAIPTAAFAAFGIFQTYAPGAVPPSSNLRQENFFGITGAAWNNFVGDYPPGLGNPAVATDDYYHQNGLSAFRPYDLLDPSFTGVCASAGASIAATLGKGRYAWPLSPDHGVGDSTIWNGSFDFRIGYSNDPGVPPARMLSTGIAANTSAPTPTISTVTASISDASGSAPGNRLRVTAYTGLISNAGQASISGAGVTTAVISSQSSGTAGQTGDYVIAGAAQLVASQTMSVIQGNYTIYYGAQLVCNPDDAVTPFYIYSEGICACGNPQHQMGVIKSADLVTWTLPQPTHNALNFGTWSSFQRVNRISTGVWESKGLEVGYPYNGNVFARSTWTSTDGLVWAPGTTNLNNCIPASSQSGTTTSCTGSVRTFNVAQSPYTVPIAGVPWLLGNIDSVVGSTRIGNQWVGRAAVNSNQSVIDSPAAVNVSGPYGGLYPGPSYLQTVTGYVEDGIAHYYAVKGWPISSRLWFVSNLKTYSNGGLCKSVPPVNGTEGYFGFTAKIDNGSGGSGDILDVTAISSNSILVGSQIFGGVTPASNTFITSQLSGPAGGIGTYRVSNSQNIASTSAFFGSACGGLWQSGMDYYTEIVDATAAAAAAPVGVKASCTSSVASLTWFDALPTQTYRLYRGTTAGSQTTLVGDFTGTAATDTSMTLNALTYYKLVYLNGGVEKKNRVVSTYCSNSIYPEVNAHFTRALTDGADPATCNQAMMDSFYAWLTTNGKKNNLLFATMPEFCVAQSGNVTKIFDMGTTRLPRGGDYTPMSSGTTYNATGIGGKPAWVNGANTARGYYGGDPAYLNNIRRKTQITIFSAYQKPGTAQAMLIASGQITSRMYLSHDSGTPGTISCAIYDATQQKIATATPASATAFNTASCTFDGTDWKAWSNAVAGSAQTGLVIPSPDLNPPDALTGQIGTAGLTNVLVAGDNAGLYNRSSGSFSSQGNVALYNGRAFMIFDIALTGAEQTSLDALVR